MAGLLRLAGLARSTFYYQRVGLAAADKYAELKARIREIFNRHKGRYGYRRVTAALRQIGQNVNHKTVQRLMSGMQLRAVVRVKRFRRFEGNGSHVAPNLLQRDFRARRPHEKWVTDVTEFKVRGQKLYLSPIMDLYNGEIVAYDTADLPMLGMVENMLRGALKPTCPHERLYCTQIKVGSTACRRSGSNSNAIRSCKACRGAGTAWTMRRWKASSER